MLRFDRGAWTTCMLLALAAVGIAGGVAGCSHSGNSSSTATRITAARDIHRDTNQAATLNAHAAELLEKRKYDDAEPELQKAIAADGMYGPAHVNLGNVYYHQRNFYKAAWEYEYAAKLMPQQAEPRNNLGLVFEATNRLDEAIKEYSAAIQLAPDDPRYLGNAARARIERGDHDAELRDLLLRLIARDTRPEWVQWAKTKMSLLQQTKAD